MIETAHTARMQQAFDLAHKERGETLSRMVGWLFGKRDVPLGQPVLTELSRCA
ncbi:hypothetical protein [uncultured Shimia sp.]|uniref:hypothetical protein n=1 Tax=uncultured Shimia sp. TaxID=573152 RepID=UPI00260690EB|nr:hypothetical protein [uncultured Shimia sp.]